MEGQKKIMKKEQKNQVKERLESILKEELKPIESTIKLIEEAKEEKKFSFDMNEKMTDLKNYQSASRHYKKYRDMINLIKFLEHQINNKLLYILNCKILVVFFEEVKNTRDKTDFEKIINEELKQYNISWRIYSSSEDCTIYYSKNYTSYNDYYKYNNYIGSFAFEGYYGNYYLDFDKFENAKKMFEERIKANDNMIIFAGTFEELKENYYKINELKEQHEKETEEMLEKHKEEMLSADDFSILSFIK